MNYVPDTTQKGHHILSQHILEHKGAVLVMCRNIDDVPRPQDLDPAFKIRAVDPKADVEAVTGLWRECFPRERVWNPARVYEELTAPYVIQPIGYFDGETGALASFVFMRRRFGIGEIARHSTSALFRCRGLATHSFRLAALKFGQLYFREICYVNNPPDARLLKLWNQGGAFEEAYRL